MKIDDLKTLFELKGNEYQLGSLSGDEFNLLANLAQRDYFNFLLGHIEQFQYGRPIPRVGLSMSDNVMLKLSPFRKRTQPTVPDNGSVINKPAKFKKLLRMGIDTLREINPCDPTQLSAKLSSVIVPIEENPVYEDLGTQWQLYPGNLQAGLTIIIDYIEEPVDMKWNFTKVNNRESYIESGSVHPQWADSDMNHILSRMLKHKGVPFKDNELIGNSNNEIDKGE